MRESIELQDLRVFLTLAEELHFGHTAERLGLTSSRVSQSLRGLERKLGGQQLFHRTSRRVTLTPFGEQFLAECRPAFRQLAEVIERAHAAGRGLVGLLRLGLLAANSGGPHLTVIIGTFERQHPGCEVRVVETSFTDPLGALNRGEIDLMATPLPITRPGIVVGPVLASEPRVLAVSRDHRLADRTSVSIEDVADFYVAPITETPEELIAAAVPRTTPQGRPIRRLSNRPPRTPNEVATLVARGKIVHPTTPSFADYYGHPDIVYLPIDDLPPMRHGLAWRRGAADSKVHEFIRTARTVLRVHR